MGDLADFQRRISGIFSRNWLTNDGPEVREFERQVAEIAGTRNCIATCNATVALNIAVRATGLTGEVITPSFTFAATAHALQWSQLTPVFCDIDPATHNIDPGCAERMITPRTSGIIGVHVWGRPCKVDALQDFAQRNKLVLIYDACHAFGNTEQERPIGQFGRASVFSFHATKFINCAEGGAVVTDDDELAKRMRCMRNFGFEGYDNVVCLGTNGKMSELAAAMGLTSLACMRRFIDVNRRNYRDWKAQLSGLAGIALHDIGDLDSSNCQYVVIEVGNECPLSRDQVIQVLHSKRVLARRYFFPGVHNMEPYRSLFPDAGLTLPHTEAVSERVLVLPTGTSVTSEHISAICDDLRAAFDQADELRVRLPKTIPVGGAFNSQI